MSAGTMVVGIRFQADTNDAIRGNQEVTKSFRSISESLKDIASRAVASSNSMANGAKEAVKSNKQIGEELKKQSNVFKNLQQQATQSLSATKARLTDFTQSVKQNFVQSVNSVGQFVFSLKNIASGISAIPSPMKQVISIGADFEYQMSAIGAVSSATDEEMAFLGKGMRELAATSAFSASQVGEAGANMARAGFSVKDTMASLPGVLALAAASGESLGTSSQIAAEQLNAFKMETKEMSMVADLFAKAANASNVGVAELGESMKYSSPIFKAAGQSIQTVVAATSLLANVGIHGSQSGTTLRMAMLRLAGPPTKAAEALEKLGVEVSEVGGDVGAFSKEMEKSQQALEKAGVQLKGEGGKFRDFGDILADLNKGMQGLGQAEKIEKLGDIFGAEAASGMLELVEQSKEFQKTIVENGKSVTVTTTAFKEFRKEVSDNAGFAQKTSDIMLNNLKGDWNAFTGNLEELALSIFDIVGPLLRPLVRLGTEWVQSVVAGVQSIVPVMAAFRDGFMSAIEPIKNALNSLGSAIAPTIEILKVTFAPLTGQLEGSGKAFDTFKSAAQTTGVVLANIVSIGLMPFVTAVKIVAPLVNMVSVGVANLTGGISKLVAQFSVATSGMSFFEKLQHGASMLLMMDWGSAGKALVTTFIAGITATGQEIYSAVLGIFSWVGNLFPHSDAKEGPFSNLTASGQSIISTLASGVIDGGKSLVSSISEIFSEVPPVIHLALVPGLALVTNLLTRNIPLLAPLTMLSDVIMRLAGGFMGFNMTYKKTATSVDEVVAKTSLLKRVLIGVGGALVLAMTNEPGRALIATFAEGVKSAGKVFFDAVSNVFGWVASLLPHSDADTGPFSNLFQSGVSLIQTFAKGAMSVGGWLVNSIKGLFANVSSTMIATVIGGLAVMATKGMKMPTSASAVMGVASKAASGTAMVAGGVVNLTKTIFGMFTGISQLITGLSTFANLLVSVSRLLLNFVLSFTSLGKTIAILTPIIYLVRSFKTEFMAIAESALRLDFSGVAKNFGVLITRMKEAWVANWRRLGEEYKDSFIGKVIAYTNGMIDSTKKWWGDLYEYQRGMFKNVGVLLSGVIAFFSLFKKETVVFFLKNMGSLVTAISPMATSILLITSVVVKAGIIWELFHDEVVATYNFISNTAIIFAESISGIFKNLQDKIDAAGINIRVFSAVVQTVLLYALPLPPLFKGLLISMAAFDGLLVKIPKGSESLQDIKTMIASITSGIGMVLITGNPLLAVIGSLISTLVVFREEIVTALSSAKDYWLDFFSSMSTTSKLIIAGIAGISAVVALFATGIISLPVVVIGAVSGAIAGLGTYRKEFLEFFDSITSTWQMAILGFGAVAVAALAISMKRIFGFLSDQKNAAAKAKACITSPLMACTVVDDEEAEKNLRKRFLAAKRKGLDTLDTGDKKDCTGLFGGCEKDITQQSQLLSNSATAAGNANKAAADTSRRSWLSFGGILSGIGNTLKFTAATGMVAFSKLFSSMSSLSSSVTGMFSKMGQAAKQYVEDAKWTGSAHTDPNQRITQEGSSDQRKKPVTNRANEMWKKQYGESSKYTEEYDRKRGEWVKRETEEYRKLKEEAARQAAATRTFTQSLVVAATQPIKTFKEAWATGYAKVTPYLTKLSESAGRMWDGAVTKSGPFFDKMWQSVTNLSTRMSSAFQNMGAAVSPMWNQVKTTGLSVFNQIRNAGSNIASTWQWARGEMWATFKAASLSTWQSIKVASQSTFSTLRLAGITAWTHIKAASQMAMQTSISVLRTTGASLWTTFKVAGVQAWTAIKIAALNSQTQIKLAGSNIANIWQRANAIIWPAFQTAGVATWGILKTTGLSSLATFRSAGTLVWTVFKEVGLLTFAPIKTAGVFAFNQIKMAGVSILSFWQSAAGTIWPTFKAAGILTWNTIKATGMSSWSAFQLAGASIWATTKSAGVSAWASVKTASGTIWPQFQAIGMAVWNPIKVAGLNTFAQLKMASSHISSTWQWARGEMWATFKAAGLSTLTSIKLASASVWATMGGPVITRGIGQAFTTASAHSARFWTGFKAFSTPAISASTGFIGRAFTVASSHTANFWARFTAQGEVATTATQSRLSGMFSKKTAMIGAIAAGTVATTLFSSQDAAASELGNTPKVDVEGTQSQLKSAFSLTSIKEQWSQDLTEMLDKFGLLKPIGDAIAYTLENMETVGMGAMMVLSTGLLDLGMAFTVIKTGAAALGAFFIGWQIGSFIYNQFTIVQESAITVVGAFVRMGQGIGEVITSLTDSILNFRMGDFTQSLLASIQNLPTGLAEIVQSVDNVWHGLGDVLMAPAKIMGDLITIVGTMIGEFSAALSQGNFGDAALAIVSGIAQGVWSVAGNLTEAVLGIAKMAISAILPESWYQAGADLLSAFGGGIASAAQSVWDAVLGAFNWVWNLFPHSDANEGPFAQLTTSGQGLMTAFVNGVLSLPTLLLDAITGIFTGVTTYLESIIYSDRGAAIIMSIKDGILSLPTLLVDGVTTLFTSVSTYLESIVYSDRGVAIITSIRDGILSAPTLIIDSVRQVFDSVMQYITTIDFTEAGRKLLSTVGDGIKQGAQELTSAVSDGLTSVRQYLPFSDAKVGPLSDLTASGQSIPSTLATGVAQNSETLTATVADMTQQGSGAMGALETAAASTATSVKATATEATQSLAEAEERLRIAKEKLFELSQKKSLTTSRSEKKQITQEEVGVRQEVHDAQAAVRQLRESTKEQTAIQKAAAKEAEKAAKEANKVIKESAKEAARDMKESLYGQADALTNVSKQYKEAAKATEEFADKLKRTYESLSYARNELVTSNMNEMQRNVFQNVGDYGTDYGPQIAQVKMLTSANQELTSAKNELAKAGMSESQARLFDLQQKYTENVALEIYQTQELAKTKKALYEESQKSRESQLVGDQKEYVDLMKQVGVEEGKRIILQRQALSNQAKLKQESATYWDSMSEKAGEYYEKFATGQMSAKQSLKGFFSSVLEEQKKAALEKSKQAFLGLFGLGKDKGQQDSQVQRDLDKAAQFMKQSNDSVVAAGKDMSGTIAKAVEDAGKNLSTSVDNLGKQVNETLQKAADLTAKSDSLEKAAGQLKETASDISITRAGNDALTSQNEVGKASENLSQALDKTGDGVTKTTGEIVSANQKYVKVTNEVASALEGASKKFNYSLLELSRMASLESSFNANVKNSSGYMGLFQFKGAASKEVGISGREYDPRAAAEGAIKYWEINQKTLDKVSKGWRETAEKMNINEGLMAWMAHNQGAGGLGQVLKTLTTGVDHLSQSVERNLRNNLLGGEGKNLSGVALAEKYMEGWIKRWNTLPLPEQFKSQFQSAVGQGVVTVAAKASEEAGKAAGNAIRQFNLTEVADLRVKGGLKGQAFAGGKTEEGTMVLAQAIQGTLGSQLKQFTAFNDKYHAGTSSGHAKGLKLDLTLMNPAESTKVAEQIRELGRAAGVTVKVLDEYKNPSKRSTGGHIDVGFASQTDAKKFAEAMRSGGAALGDLSKATAQTTQMQTQATKEQGQSFQTRLKNEQEVTDMTAVLAEAKKTEQAASADLAIFATQQKQQELVGSQNYDAALQLVRQGQLQSLVQDADVVGQHAQATAQTVTDFQKGAAGSLDLVQQAAADAGAKMGEAAGQCLAEVTQNPAIETLQEIKTDACSGGQGGGGLFGSIGTWFSGLKDKLGGLFSGSGEAGGGFWSSITSGIGNLFSGGGSGGGIMSAITGGIGKLFGGGGDGIMSTITSGIGKLFGGSGGGGGSILSSLGSLLGGGQSGGGSILSTIGGMLGGGGSGGGIGNFISGLSGSLGNLTGGLGGVGKAISGLIGGGAGGGLGGLVGSLGSAKGALGGLLGGGGSTPGMGALSVGLSMLKGDMAGAAVGAAQLLGSMTPLGPIGGMIAGKLMSMSGIGAKFVRTAEWINVSMKGLDATYSKSFTETRKGGWLVKSKTRTGTEALDEGTIKKLNDMLGESKKTIEKVSETLNLGNNDLLKGMGNFRYNIQAMENKDQEWFDKSFQTMRTTMVKSAVDNIMLAGADIKTNLGGNFQRNFKQVLDGTFNQAARAETWDGVLTSFVSSADKAMKGGLQDEVSAKLGERLTDFVNNSADQLKDLPVDQLQNVLTGEIGKIFTDVTGIAIPESITGELAEVFASRIQDAIKLSSGEEISGDVPVIKTDEIGFYRSLKEMVNAFDGPEEELNNLINQMLGLKEVFKSAGLSTTVMSKGLIDSLGGVDKFSSSMTFFKDNFASVSDTNIEFTNSLSGVNKSLKEIQDSTLPGINTAFPTTREEFYKLTQSVAKLGKDGEETFAALIKGAPQFANYYKAIEDFNQKFGGASGTTLKAQAKKAVDLNKTLNDSFKGLGIELPKTRKGLYDLVQGFDLTNESQRKLHDKILELAPAFDELFTNNEQVDKFRESMRGVYDSAGGAEKTISDLSKQFPELNLGASAMTLNTKEAARSLANMSDGELMAWAESMGLTGLSIEDITQKTTDYLTAATELQTNIGSFKDEMHKIATGATDNEAALSKLVDKYPMLSDSLTQAGVTATDVAGYFDQMSPDQLKALADSLGVTVDTLMADTQTYIGILQSQSDMFKSINGESLGGDLMKVMTDANVTSANEAGRMFADNFVSQFESQMVSTVLNSVMQTIYQGVVEPFLTSSAQAAMNITEGGAMAGTNLTQGGAIAGSNLAEGSGMAGANLVQGSTSAATTSATGGQMAASAMATGGMLAGDALAKIVEDAKQKIIVMGQVMAELKSSGVMDQITSSLSTVGETAYNTFSTAAPTLFEPARQKQESEASKTEEASNKEAEKVAEKQREEERQQIEESQKAAEDARKTFTDFNKSLGDLSSGLEGNAKTINDLKTTYKDATVTQLLATSSSKDMITQLQGLSQTQLEGIAKAAGVEVSKLTGDLLSLVDITKQSEKAMGDFRNKMAITAGTTTEYEQTIAKLQSEYPKLTSTLNSQGLSSKELAKQLSTMDDSQIKSIADSLSMSTDQFLANSESYVGALKSQEEALKSQADNLKSFRDSLEEIANPNNQGKQKTINVLDKEFAGLGLAAQAMTLDTQAAAKAMLSIPDDQLIAFAEQYGLTTDQLKEKTVAYFGAVNELQQGMDSWRGKMSQMVSGESEATTNIKSLSQKSPYLTEMTQGMDSKAMAKFFSGLDNTQIEALANQYGVSIEKFEADTESWVNSTKTIEEETKNLAQGFVEFRTKMGQIATGTSDAQVSLSKLSNTYGDFSDVQGKSSKELATYFSTLSDADITSLAVRFGVTTDQFKADAETFVSSTQSMEDVTKSQAASMKEFRDSLVLMSGAMTDNELSLKNLSDKYPSLSGILNDSSMTAKEAAERFNSLSDDELRNLATLLGTDFDTLKADAGTWLGILKQQDDGLKESTKAISDFQNEMRKTAGAANDSQITLEGLTAKYPALATAINDSSMTAKEAATQFASMDMQSLMNELGILPAMQAEFIADSQAWVGVLAANDEAIKANQEAMAGYRDTMLKATGTYGDSDIALKNLTASYPTLASTLNSTSLSAKDAATYFGQLSDAEFEGIAKSLGKTTDQLRTDSTEWVNTLAANEEEVKATQESFNSFHETMVKLKGGVTDNDLTLQKLAGQYPSLSSQILKSGLTAEQAAGQFANLSEADLDSMAASLGVTTDKLKEDIQAFANALPSGQVFKDLRTGLAELINPLQGAEKTIDDLAKKYPDLNLATNALGLNVTEAATAIQGMTDNDMLAWAEANKIAPEEAKEATLAYLGAVKELQGQIGSFKDKMHQMATGMTDNEATLERLKKQYPSLSEILSKTGVTAQDVAKQFDSMSSQQIADMAKSLGVSVEAFMGDVEAYTGVLSAQAEETKAKAEQLSSFRTEMTKLGGTLSESELTLNNLTSKFPSLIDSLKGLGTNSKDVANQLASLDDAKLEELAKASKVTTDQFLENATTYINTLASQEAETKAAIQSVQGMQDGFKKLTSGMKDSEYTVNQLGSKYPNLISSMGLSGKTAEEVASQFASMDPARVVEMAKSLGVSTDDFVSDIGGYVSALQSMAEEAKAITDSLNGFRGEMDKMASSMTDYDYTLSNLSKTVPNLTSKLGGLGSTSQAVAGSLSRMNADQLEAMAKQAGLSVDEFINNSKSYVEAMKARESSIEEEQKKANEEAQKQADEAAEKAKQEAEKVQADLMKQVDKFFDVFGKLADKLGAVSESIASDIQSFDTQDENAVAARRNAQMQALQKSLNDFKGIDLAKEIDKDSAKESEKAIANIEKYRKLLMEESKFRIDAVTKEKDAVLKTHDEIIAGFTKLKESVTGIMNSIADDITALDAELGKGGKKTALKEKTSGEFADAIATFQSSMAKDAGSRTAIGKVAEIDTTQLQGVSASALQQSSQSLLAISEANIAILKQGQENSKQAIADGEKLVKLGEEYRKGIGEALREQLADLDKANEAVTKQLEKTQDETIKRLEKERDEKIKSAEKARDDVIKSLETERDTKIKHLEEVQEAAKKLQETLTKVKDAVASLQDAVKSDMEKLAKDMSLPGTTAIEKLNAMQGSISSNMPVTEESVKKLETYKGLILESLQEQIDLENQRFEKQKEAEAKQLDHYNKLIDFSKQLKGFLDDLKLGELTTYNPTQRLAEARRQYEETLRLAKSGDEEAMGQVTAKAQGYLKEAQGYYASSEDYTNIFNDVNSNISDLKGVAEAEADKIAKELPLDKTETAKNIANLLPLQQAAMEKLQGVNSLLTSMGMDIATQLTSPAATPMPDDQFSAMIEKEKENFTNLIETQKTDTDKLIENTKTDTDKLIESTKADTEKAIADNKANTEAEGNKLRELAKAELQSLNTSLGGIESQLQAASEKTFDDTDFANNVTALQQASVGQLVQLGNYVIAMDAGLKSSLKTNIDALMSQLSPENQLIVAERLDEAMQRNITGPLYELISAVNGEKVKAEISDKQKEIQGMEAGYKNNQTALDNALQAFGQFREITQKTNLSLSFDEFVGKLSGFVKNTADSTAATGYVTQKDWAGINQMLEGLGLTKEMVGQVAGQIEVLASQILTENKTQQFANTWTEFKSGYLQSNAALLTAFQTKQGQTQAEELAKYRELGLVVSGLEKSLSMMKGAAVNSGRSESELYGSLDKRSTQSLMEAKGVKINIDTYGDFLKAKETLEELRKSLIGVSSLKGELDGLNGKLTATKASITAVPKIEFNTPVATPLPAATKTPVAPPNIFEFMPKSPSSQPPVGMGKADVLQAGGGANSLSISNVSSSGAKDIIIKLTNLSSEWQNFWKGRWDKEGALNEKLRTADKEATEKLRAQEKERLLAWRATDRKAVEDDVARQLTWRKEDLARHTVWREEDLARHTVWREEDLMAAANRDMRETIRDITLATWREEDLKRIGDEKLEAINLKKAQDEKEKQAENDFIVRRIIDQQLAATYHAEILETIQNVVPSIAESFGSIASEVLSSAASMAKTSSVVSIETPPVGINTSDVNTSDDGENLPSYDVGTPSVPADMTAKIHQKEIIVDPQSSEILRNYGIRVNVNEASQTSRGGDSKRMEELLLTLIEEVRYNNRLLEQQRQQVVGAVNNLEITVGQPITRAIKQTAGPVQIRK